ncbi:MAG: tRNA 2-thiouridine(34) synthase MnmA [Deltaproteobacteria bacterium]|jgi:tRNA-specific 2-thiouridylase|nr:tRNA 2-thiouridine(34) synthase MnmA [Deltaproteobacteria bacterium]
MKILVGLSGGVDSATAAYILKEAGHEVVGVTMAILDPGLKLNAKADSCLSADEATHIREAEDVAKFLDIPFYIIDCKEEYKKLVLENFKQEYLSGRTPNPCVRCNSLIKFGALLQGSARQGIRFDKFATGHYAQIVQHNGRYAIKRGGDPKKDQSYFIYRLSQEQLSNLMFPLGAYTKREVRELARSAGLPVSEKKESQDFYGGDYAELLGEPDRKGKIVDTHGKVLGEHNGFWYYTIGQRKGLGVSAESPLYVVDIDVSRNEVVLGYESESLKTSFEVESVVSGALDVVEKVCQLDVLVKVRSAQIPKPAKITIEEGGAKILCELSEPQRSITPGQSAVFYRDDLVLCGGVIV